ncbi:MAG: RagB/SusD family nutrient uptake outer membrane protein, partial [Bacteroidetes bacterium]|nr:RagB/SusD family nutrient uptake outer membrane protein [Bacteroidota bacterium]
TQIINSGDYSLETEDYFNMFGLENEGHPELIFAFEQNESTGGYGSMAWFQSSRNRHRTPANPGAVGSDGSAMTQEFYDIWEGFRDDPRFFTRNIPDGGSVPDEEFEWNRGIQIGQQYGIEFVDGSQSQFKRDENGDLLIVALTDFARSGDPMIYTREIGITTDSGHMAGARSLKWDLDPTTVNRGDSNINMPWLRLGEVYLMRAEAYARTGNWGEALNDINELRAARGARQLQANELDSLDEVEREWYFEMYHEHWTRTIQIRFGNWEDTWRDKTSTDPIRRVFPIPQEAIDLAQSEPGYLEQNPGY